jgi:small subunit ribosomal protein S18
MAKEEVAEARPRKSEIQFDYKDVKLLTRYINQFGQIESRRRTGLNAKQQHDLAVAIKRARHLALLPFVTQ